MSGLRELIRVNTNYTRSINIERDSEEAALVRPYVLTTRAKQLLERISTCLRAEDSPRAWAVIGPYGAGKSAFGLYLSRLLGNPDTAGHRYARETLREADPSLYSAIQKYQRGSRGFCSIALTGSPEPLAQRLVRAMLPAAEAFFAGRRGRNPNIVEELRRAIDRNNYGISNLIALMTKLQEAVSRAEGRGVLVVIDELGKFLEYEARHRGATDIYLLQALAEHSVRKGPAPLILVVLLHQAIELYAQTLGEQLKNEWKKVQGRFETIPFLESTEQTLRVVKAAISSRLPKGLHTRVRDEVRRVTKTLDKIGALPQGLPAKEAQSLFASCFPLHPVSLLILPTLCQRIAQNERTLFSYLGSHEPFGFADSMARLDSEGQRGVKWIMPAAIYEYFILNQPGLMSDQSTHRRWAEVTTALDRLGDAPESESELLKAIGLLNIVGAQGGLKASDELLDLCLTTSGRKGISARRVAQSLVARSIVTYRRFNHEYRVWQGSDFDLDVAVRDQRAQIGKIDPADVLNELSPLPPLIARRHAIETGTLRYFAPQFVGAAGLSRVAKTDAPVLFVCLAESPEEVTAFHEAALRIGRWHSPAVICEGGAAIREAVTDVMALRRIQRESPELANDPIAQRELRDRLASAVRTERELIGAIYEMPEQFGWAIGGSTAVVESKRDLQVRLSGLLDQVYERAPFVRNELINRDRPSATANAARKKLLVAMLDRPEVADLGIEKFPAEKAMYRAILLSSGLHRDREGKWEFQSPGQGKNDPCRMRPVWDAVLELLGEGGGVAVSVVSLYEALAKPPYGIKAGVLPVLLVAMYQAMKDEIALSENGQFIPFLTTEVLESLLNKPEAYALQHFGADARNDKLIASYAEAITGEVPSNANLMSVLQPLAKLMVGLPDYTKQTKRLSERAIAVRDLFFSSKMPVELVYAKLPSVFGMAIQPDFNERKALRDVKAKYRAEHDTERLNAFKAELKAALTELRVAYHALLGEIVDMVKEALALDPKLGLFEVRDKLRGQCSGLDTYTIDQQCTAFIGRLVDPFGDESQWLVSLASFLARKPPEKWIDDDISAARFRLKELASRVRDLRQLQLHYEGARETRTGDLEASLIRVISTRDGEQQALVTLDDRGRAAVHERAARVRKVLESLPNNELRLATLAQVFRSLNVTDETSATEDAKERKHDTKGAA
jgi:hypothetical protein